MPNANLDWRPVLLVRVTRELFKDTSRGLQVSRVHLARHPKGVICAAWDVPTEQRRFPRARFVGWKPARDVPFDLPVRFERRGDPPVSAVIPNGTWILPYDEEQYRLYHRLRQAWNALMAGIDSAPHSPYTLGFVRSLVITTSHSPSPN
jgi:hypothetical protein